MCRASGMMTTGWLLTVFLTTPVPELSMGTDKSDKNKEKARMARRLLE
jgi:hypothetical protein